MSKMIEGTIVNNSGKEISRLLEGIKIIASDWCDDKNIYFILGTTEKPDNEEDFNKLTQALFNLEGHNLGYKNIEEFRWSWKEEGLQGVNFAIPKQDLTNIRILYQF